MNQDTVKEILAAALAAVNDANVPNELRPLAFEKAVDLLAGIPAPIPPSPPVASRESGLGDGDGGGAATEDERLATIARKTGVDVSKLPYVYDLDEDDVTILLKRSALGAGDAAATRELALLYTAARQAASYDAQTSMGLVRAQVENMGVYDPKNFTTHLKNIDGVTIKGSGKARELKVSQHGFEEAGKLITRLTGGES